ncbi:MAG: histidine triad nucleotide-binding protein [Candidatus Omnitrophota bacterium]
MDDCIFCKVAEGEIKAGIVYSDDVVLAFNDIKPQAPVHILVIPRRHIERFQDVAEGDMPVMNHMLNVIPKIARIAGIDGSGYRLVINCDRDAGQEVFHLHAHLMGGRKFSWPPG